MRIAAVGDVHFGPDSAGRLRPRLEQLAAQAEAEALLIAGDLTRTGDAGEAAVLGAELRQLPYPVVAVLGNHDWHRGQERDIRAVLEQSDVIVLDGEAAVLELPSGRLGVAGCKGFGGGFAGACATDFGEPEMKLFVGRARREASRLEEALASLRGDLARIALLHYSPVAETLMGERAEIHAFLGSYLLAEAIDRAGADLALHGHAHNGAEDGATPGGVPVHNVAMPVIKRACRIFEVAPAALVESAS
jgi:Icc-related predicted phosphoesterase